MPMFNIPAEKKEPIDVMLEPLNLVVTTTDTIPNKRITKIHGLVLISDTESEFIAMLNIKKRAEQFKNGVMSIRTLEEGLKHKAKSLSSDANAVIGVKYSIKAEMFQVLIGTAVTVEDIEYVAN